MKVYLVGGAVRDQLLGLTPKERDWVVVGSSAKEMEAQGYVSVGKHFPVFLHPNTHEEYALARKERKTAPGHKGFQIESDASIPLEIDLQRRDLTINAIAQDQNGALIDPYGGQNDIRDRILRHVSEAFTEDPLRVFRVARFKATLGQFDFAIAPETLQLMQQLSHSGELSTLPSERIWREFEKAIHSNYAEHFFDTLWQCGAMRTLHSKFAALSSTKMTVVQNCLNCVKKQSSDAELKAAVFFNACAIELALDKESLTQILNAFGLPRSYQQLCQIVFQNVGYFSLPTWQDAEALLEVLVNLEVLRNPSRYKVSLQAIDCLTEMLLPDQCKVDFNQLQSISPILRAIDHKKLQKNHSEKDDFLAALKIERIKKIEALLADINTDQR